MSMHAENPKDYEPEFQPPRFPYVGKRKAGHKKLYLIIGAAIAVLAIAGGAVWYIMSNKPAPKTPSVAASHSDTTSTTPSASSLDPATASTTQTHKSTKLNIQVTYRKDWTLAESNDKSELTLSSPSTTYAKADGSSATGVFTVKIREDVPAAMQTTIQKAVATQDSTIIGYAQFTPNQRQYTNLSFAGTKTGVFNFFMVTGDNAYKTGAPFGTGIDFTGTTYLIAGGYGSDATGSLTFDSVPLASADSTVYQQALDIVKNLQIY